ncbi:MAG: type II toxin-antitoxin system prevent-host-death family antitoxin [Gammaproteobacteria bacterium]|nr:type II toxin-antitoxin system prevent-host-death family antitoxin [Gammaproteobacteria bacterium]MBU1655836.1 type II toxin-antitoxin system prevent-host-death family antitoxin [Gammaproteobacteria bacterium]MBU1960559.1 type II toxin-antitoxin system prevent-host-death family antitoxin [Gammaproteobacteria bacterium]
MVRTEIGLADAKAHLSQLTERVAGGEDVLITKRGKPVVLLTRPDPPRQPLDLDALRRLTAGLPRQAEDAGLFIRKLRDEARY